MCAYIYTIYILDQYRAYWPWPNLPGAVNIWKAPLAITATLGSISSKCWLISPKTLICLLKLPNIQNCLPASLPGCGTFVMKIELKGPKCFWFIGKEVKPDRNQIGKSLQRHQQQQLQWKYESKWKCCKC